MRPADGRTGLHQALVDLAVAGRTVRLVVHGVAVAAGVVGQGGVDQGSGAVYASLGPTGWRVGLRWAC